MIRSVLLASALSAALYGQDGAQRFASLGDFRLENGDIIRDCRVGYRTFGALNAARSNAILFPTWFTGTSEDLAGNFGPGKLVDSGKYYVIAVDALGNGVSASPSNSKLQPRMKFPRFSIRDMVESQHRLLTEVLQLHHLRAVMGISMGGMQTFEWMVAYPDFMDRAIPIVGSTKLTPYDLLLWEAQIHAIESDAAWKHGDYVKPPEAAMKTVADIHALALTTPRRYVEENRGKDFAQVLAETEKSSTDKFDANDRYRQLEAMIGHDVSRRFGGDMARAAAAVKARVLVVAALEDHMVNPQPALEFARRMQASTLELAGDCGHLSPGCEAARLNPAAARALE
jgi:homoserine O-acetyltransferase